MGIGESVTVTGITGPVGVGAVGGMIVLGDVVLAIRESLSMLYARNRLWTSN